MRDFKSLTLMHGHFMAAAGTAVTYSSPTYTYDLAPHHTRISPVTLGTPILTQVPLIHSAPPHPCPALQRRDDKKMSKHAAADLGQRAQTLAPAVESGGRTRTESGVGESIQRAAGSSEPCHGSYWHLRPRSPDSKPSPSPPSPNYRQAHIFLGQLLLKTDGNKKT